MEENDQTLHGYQIVRLKRAIAGLEAKCPGLAVSVEWTGENETTAAGRMPTVQYKVSMDGRTVVSEVGVAMLSAKLAESLRRALHLQPTAEIDFLIDRIAECPVL